MPVIDLDAKFKELSHDLKQALGIGSGNDPAEVAKLKTDHATATAEVTRLTTELATRTTERDDLKTKVTNFETAEQNKNATALTAAKDAAKKMALTAYKQGTQEYTDAVALIEAQRDPVILATFTRGYEAEAKAAGVPNPTRTTEGTNPVTQADQAALEAKLEAAKTAGEKANKTGKAN